MKKTFYLFIFLFLASKNMVAQSGHQIFDESYVHDIHIHFDQAFYWDTLCQRYLESIDLGPLPDSALGANDPLLSSYVIIDGIRTDSVGIRQKGYFSNWGADSSLKKPLKISFNEFVAGRTFDGLKDINLSNAFKDPTMLHDALSYRLMREAGIAAPRTSFANIYINDTLWGLYVLVEQINKTFLQEHFGNNDGNLYKVIESNLEYHGSSPEPYRLEFEKKTNESLDDWTDLIQLVEKINTTSYFVYADTLSQYMDMEGFLKTLAMDVSLNNWDSYFEHGRNFYLYHNPIDNLFHWIPWDYNLSFAEQDYQIMLPDSRDRKPLIKKSFNNSILKEHYLSYLCEINQHLLTLSAQSSYIDSVISLLNLSVRNDPNYFYPSELFIQSINIGYNDSVEIAPSVWEVSPIKGLKPWIANKNNFLYIEISNEFFNCENQLQISSLSILENLFIYPNPSSFYVTLSSLEDLAFFSTKYTLYNSYGVPVKQGKLETNILQVDDLENGVYILEIIAPSSFSRGKLVIQH